MKDKTTTVLLAFFLGGFGIHRFYLRQTSQGILYLVFFWTFIPAFIALIDFIGFLIMTDETFNAKYNSEPTLRSNNKEYVADELEKLHNLKEKGIINQEEYDSRKNKLLE